MLLINAVLSELRDWRKFNEWIGLCVICESRRLKLLYEVVQNDVAIEIQVFEGEIMKRRDYEMTVFDSIGLF